MDPALWELLRAEAGADDREIEAIIRFVRPETEIPDVQIVSRFGAIATCRIRARDVIPVRARPEVASLKAARGLSPGSDPGAEAPEEIRPTDVRRSPGLTLTGKGVVVASVDWGVDVDSAAFRWPADSAAAGDQAAGGTRFLSFWDQRDQALGPRADPYGYGAVHDRSEIDSALEDPRPYERLGYHPAIADRAGRGAHGTHVLDIAAGNGEAGGPVGIAPDADLIFVHLADRHTGGLANFGDSVRLLEAVDYISRAAGAQPCVINISAGRTCGPKDGSTLVERALDELLASTPGRFVVNSAGNYFGWRTHSCGRLAPGEAHRLTFAVDPADVTLNELEIWYDGADEFTVRVDPPGYITGQSVHLGERSDLTIDGRVVGRVYHRRRDPNNGDNHIVAYIDPIGRQGSWTVTLEAQRVSSGRFHAWIERDDSCRGCQARFTPPDSNPVTTIGTITTSRLPLIVGAYDGHDPDRQIASFSSSGPSRDRRRKPDLAAPGIGVLAARSAPIVASRNDGLLVRKSGTSMATPHVTGAVALCLEAGGHGLSAGQIRSLVLDSCDPEPNPDMRDRVGRGYLNIPRLIADVQQALTAPQTAPGTTEPTAPDGAPEAKEPTMNADDVMMLVAAPAAAYREFLYRPHGRLARWIDDRFEVVGRPGQPIGRPLLAGDVLLEVALGRPAHGRCTVIQDGDLRRVVSPPGLPTGQLLLRPRRRAEMSEPLPVEPPEPLPVEPPEPLPVEPTSEAGDADAGFEKDYDISAEDDGDVEPHVKDARQAWTRLFGKDNTLNKVLILDYEHVPSAAVKEHEYDAWTNSTTRIYIAKSADADPLTLEATLRHEAVHVGQFAKTGRPSSYEQAMQYELKAYRDSVTFVQDRSKVLESLKSRSKAEDEELKTAEDLRKTFQAAVDLLDQGLKEGVKQTKSRAERERWYRHYLISKGLLPDHRTLLDLYQPTKEQRNPSAQEAVESYDAASDQDGVEAWSEDGLTEGAWALPAESDAVSAPALESDSLAHDTDGTDLVGELFAEGFADIVQGADGEAPQDTGQFSAAEFAGPEHKAIGDTGSGHESSSIPFGNPPQPLTFGDVVSMAGDYFETYEQMRDLGTTAGGRTELEWARWKCLDLKRQGVPEPQATEEMKKNTRDRYLLLAARNISHFSAGGTAWQAYSLWHGKAIADALEAGQTSDTAVWRRALTKEAFGDHFLTDMFSAGHVRTPRAEIRDWYDRHLPETSEKFISYMAKYIFDRLDERQQLPPLLWWVGWLTKSIMADRIRAMGGEAVNSFSLGDIVSLALHDQDNKGLVVVSDVDPDGHVVPGGYTWTAVGDGHLGRNAHGAETKAMAIAAVIASLRDLERVRGVGVKLGNGPATLAQKTDEIRKALGSTGFAARAFVPRESKAAGANVPLTRSDGARAPLEWRWGKLGDVAFGVVDETVKGRIASELHEMAEKVTDPIDAGLGMRVHGTRNAFLSFVRHLRTDGITAIEKAVGISAR